MVLFCQAYVKLEWKSLFRSAKIRVMVEYFTEALVLDKEDSGDLDARIILYTEDLGKIIAKAKSVKRITSKLNGHLEPLNFIQVRLVEKNGFQIVDALTIANSANFKENPAVFFRLLNFIKFFKEMTFDLQPDRKLWLAMKEIVANWLIYQKKEKAIYRLIIKILGFDPAHAACVFCRGKEINFFSPEDYIFFCAKCAIKIPKKEIVLI